MKKIVFLLLFPIFSFAQWTQSQGPFTGWIGDVVSDGTTIFAGTSNGFFSKPISNSIWQKSNSGLTNTFVHAVLKTSFALFVGTDAGIFSSVNNGATWQVANTGITATGIYALAANGNNIFAGTNNGMFLSTNNGASWVAINTGIVNTYIYSIFIDGNNVWIGTGNFPYMSTNNGTSWTIKQGGLFGSFHEFHDFTKMGNFIYCATNFGVFKTNDNGTTFTNASFGLPIIAPSATCDVLEIENDGTNLYTGTLFSGVYKSVNGAGVWANANNNFLPSSDTTVSALAFINNAIYAGSDKYGGLKKSINNGTNWMGDNQGLIGNTFVNNLASNTTKSFAGAYGVGLFSTINNGAEWLPAGNSINYINFADIETEGTNVYVLASGGGVFNSNNNGVNFSASSSSIISPNQSSIYKLGNEIFMGDFNGNVYLSTNNAITWIPQGNIGTTASINSFVKDGNNLYAGTSIGIFSSANNGVSWSAINNGLIAPLDVKKIATNGSGKLMAAGISGFYNSSNNGANWSLSNAGLTIPVCFDLLWITALNHIYLATPAGIFKSTNDGAMWASFNGGLPTGMSATQIGLSGNLLITSVDESGVFYAPIDSTVGINNDQLLQGANAYPNPCVNEFIIQCNENNIAKKINIYNQIGKLICEYNNSKTCLSINTVDWAIGLYYIVLNNGNGGVIKIMKE